MDQQAGAPRHLARSAAGAFGDSLAAHFHLKKSEQVSTAWPGDNFFAITRLQSDTGIPDRTTRVPSEAALHISVSILPVPLRAYELWIDGKAIDVPYIPSLRTSVMDLQSDPVCWVGAGFDYVHYHVPKTGLDQIARDHGIEPAGAYKFAICEHDIVLAQLTRYVFPLIGSRDWTGSLALDQFSLIFGAHVLQAYAGLPSFGAIKRGGLAPWQARRAAEMIRESLDGNIHLSNMARRVRPVGQSFHARISKKLWHVALSLAAGTQDRPRESSIGNQRPPDSRHRAAIRLFRSNRIHARVRADCSR